MEEKEGMEEGSKAKGEGRKEERVKNGWRTGDRRWEATQEKKKKKRIKRKEEKKIAPSVTRVVVDSWFDRDVVV